MSTRFLAVGLVLLVATGSGGAVRACGDKFLVSRGGTRFQRAAVARKPATILIYSNPASEVHSGLAGMAVDATLTKAGYRPTTVATSDELDKALLRGGWDLVLVGMADAAATVKRLQGDRAPAVLPVVSGPASAAKETSKLYPVVLKAPAKSHSFLSAIDEALARRPKPQAKSTGKV